MGFPSLMIGKMISIAQLYSIFSFFQSDIKEKDCNQSINGTDELKPELCDDSDLLDILSERKPNLYVQGKSDEKIRESLSPFITEVGTFYVSMEVMGKESEFFKSSMTSKSDKSQRDCVYRLDKGETYEGIDEAFEWVHEAKENRKSRISASAFISLLKWLVPMQMITVTNYTDGQLSIIATYILHDEISSETILALIDYAYRNMGTTLAYDIPENMYREFIKEKMRSNDDRVQIFSFAILNMPSRIKREGVKFKKELATKLEPMEGEYVGYLKGLL